MIEYVKGDILASDAQALVNTVNLEGVMGKGIALQFKRKFDFLMPSYTAALQRGDLAIGRVQVIPFDDAGQQRFIINFPTKDRWRKKSQMRYITEGLSDLRQQLLAHRMDSVAIPPLGCGNGGLNWEDVRTEMERYLSDLQAVDVWIYASGNSRNAAPSADPPKLTPARRLLLSAINTYEIAYAETTQVELQKLAYFLKALGSSSFKDLKFKKHHYGPYAHQLQFVVEALEGYYIHGLKAMDAKAFDPLTVDYQAIAETNKDDTLSDADKTALSSLKAVIDGFESPYGLELLTTVHWVMQQGAHSVAEVIQQAHEWSNRKRRLFPEAHITIAYQHLVEKQPLFRRTPTLFT